MSFPLPPPTASRGMGSGCPALGQAQFGHMVKVMSDMPHKVVFSFPKAPVVWGNTLRPCGHLIPQPPLSSGFPTGVRSVPERTARMASRRQLAEACLLSTITSWQQASLKSFPVSLLSFLIITVDALGGFIQSLRIQEYCFRR